MIVTLAGHSTVLLKSAGTRILTDPYFGVHGNLAYHAAPKLCRGVAVDVPANRAGEISIFSRYEHAL